MAAIFKNFYKQLSIQRWDDHRYYHHSRINQSLHFVSAISFLIAYALMFKDPAMAALIGWLVSMCTRQAGHFFFEPLGYDEVNQATQEHKEAIKVGYNLRRKVVLMSLWLAAPLGLLLDPALLGLFEPHANLNFNFNTDFNVSTYLHHLGWLWLALGVSGLVFRTVQLFFIKDIQTGLVWLTKILTDPFHDVYLYHKAPLALLRGEFIEPAHSPRG